MEAVSVETMSEAGVGNPNEYQPNLELSDKQKKRSGKKKKKSRKKENELKSNDSHTNNQNGKADEAASFEEKKEGETEKTTSEDQVRLPENCLSTLPIESCQRASVSPEEPGVTLLRTDPILSTKEDSLPDANADGSNRKRSKRNKKKKKKAALSEEKMLDDAEKTTNEDQVHPPKNPLSNITIQEDSCQQAQDSCEKPEAAQLFIDPILSTREDSQSDAINMTCSERKRIRKDRKEDKDGNAMLKESGVDTNSEVTTKCNARHDSEAEASKLINTEEKTVASVVIDGCLKSEDDTVEQGKGAEVEANDTVSQTPNPKAKKSRRRKTKTVEVCNPLGNDLATSTISGSVECMENKVEKGKGAEVEADDTVSQTQTPKAKKKRRRKNKTMEVCNPLGNDLATSTKSGPVECTENNDGSAGRELMSNLESKRENSTSEGESGFQNLGKGKEKKADENTEVNEDLLGAGVCEVRSKTRKRKKRKASSADHETANMEVCEPSGNTLPAAIESGSVECLLDHSNREVLEDLDGNAGQESVVEDTTSKTEKFATSEKSGVENPVKPKENAQNENVVSNEDALGTEGVDDVGRKRKKRKRNKKKNCESVATMDSESVECLLSHSNKDGVESCDGIADGETAGKEEDSATEGKHVENVENTEIKEEDKKGEVDQDALGAEGIDKVEVKTKKRKRKKKKKSSEEQKTDNMDEKNVVSIPSKEEEPEIGGETSLSSCVLIENTVAQGVASRETGVLPRCSCEGQSTKKLVVFDLNGFLADIVQGCTGQFVPDGKISYRSVFKRPFVDSFIEFCFERYEVAIWSSRLIGLDYMTNIVMGDHAKNLLFCFDQNICITASFKNAQERSSKPLFLKDLRRVWNRFGTCLTCGKRKFDETNTLLVDDSPQKALCNPPHTGIFPSPYQYTDTTDSALGPDGELRKYLERLADAENVQKFVEENPIGQAAITEAHKSWKFYSMVVEAHK